MDNFKKFDLNENPPTVATDNTTRVFTTCQGKIQSNGFCDTCGQMGGMTTSIMCGRLNEVSVKEFKRPDPNDVAYTMHQLQMLINYLEELGIKAKWEGEFWSVEQSGILLKFLDWFDGDLKVLKNHESLIHKYFTEKLTP